MRFSIVTISYNQGRFLDEAVRSIVGQRQGDIDLEYIVVDPGSTDDSQDILARYEDEIDHLILERDQGPADGLNKGFQRSTGDVLGFINADDRLEPGALAAVRRFFLNHPNSRAVTGALRVIDDQGRPGHLSRLRLGSVLYPPRFSPRRCLDGSTTVRQQATFFRRSAWEATAGFNPQNNVSWDFELFVDMLLAGVRFDRMPTILGSFRLYGESITASILNSDRAAQKLAEDEGRVRRKLLERGFHASPPWLATCYRFAWRVRPVHRMRGWVLEWKAR